MSRPTTPLIDRRRAVDRALAIIDRDGLEAFSLRRLAAELEVTPASLYHHFRDKQAILDGVRLRIVLASAVAEPPPPGAPWQDHLRQATLAYREVLLRHPNVAPLMDPGSMARPHGMQLRDRVAASLVAGGVPADLLHAIIDSVELLAYASALVNPDQLSARERLPIEPSDGVPALGAAIAAAPPAAGEVFDLQLDALVEGWTAIVTRRAGRAGRA